MDDATDVEIVEEALDVKEEKAGNPSALDAHLDCVHHAKDRVNCCVVVL